MAHRLFVHVGMMKSGTTYLQRICDAQVESLRSSGVTWLLGSTESQIGAIQDLRDSARLMPGQKGAWGRLRGDVAGCSGDALLSQELMANMRPPKIRQFVRQTEADERHVIISVRDLSRVIPSRWQEAVQNRMQSDWPTYLASVVQERPDDPVSMGFWDQADPLPAIQRWLEHLPPEQIHVITVPPSSAGPHVLWERFASVIGLDPELSARTRGGSNASLGATSAMMMIDINRQVSHLPWAAYRLGLKNALCKFGLARRADREPKLGFPQEHWGWVEERTHRLVEDLRATGVDIVGDLGDLAPKPSSSAIGDIAWTPTDSEQLEALRDGVVAMTGRFGGTRVELLEAQAEIRRLRQQVDHLDVPVKVHVRRALRRRTEGGRRVLQRVKRR